jgi:hypothetical protein
VALPATDAATLEAHLQARGIPARFEGEQAMGYLGPPGRIYSLGLRDSLELHAYPDEAAAAAAAAGVSPDGGTVTDPSGAKVSVAWLGTPSFFRSGALLAVYVGTDEATLAALTEALGPAFAGGGRAR